MNRIVALSGICLAGLLVMACSETATLPAAPSAVLSCEALAVSPLSVDVPRSGGTFHVSVSGSCTWTTTSEVSWIAVTHGTGADLGTVTFDIAPNAGSARQGRLIVNDHAVTVTQAGLECAYTVEPGSVRLEPSGGPFRIRVTTPDECSWTAASDASWIEARTTAGSGTREALFNADRNAGQGTRQTRLRVAGRLVEVTQEGVFVPAPPPPPPPPPPPACGYSVSASSTELSYEGGVITITVSTGPTCVWSSSSPDPWIGAVSGPRTGSGTFPAQIGMNDSYEPRSGRIDVAGSSIAIVQNGFGGSFVAAH